MKTIDCKLTKNYFREKQRMCGRNTCFECPLSSNSNGKNKSCSALEQLYTSEAIEIVQRWSNENPQKTLLSEYLERYPQAELENGLPPLCAKVLGQGDEECKHEFNEYYSDCRDCWNTPKESN